MARGGHRAEAPGVSHVCACGQVPRSMRRLTMHPPSMLSHALPDIRVDCQGPQEQGASWSYRRPSPSVPLELACWNGHIPPALHAHFHDEVQITLVLSGSRSFVVRGQAVTAEAGQCIAIPAGWPHRSIPTPSPEGRCINVYASLPAPLLSHVVLPLDADWVPSGRIRLDLLVAAVTSAQPASQLQGPAQRSLECQSDMETQDKVSDMAERRGMSREGFTRSFSRTMGLPPHSYRTISRLNQARAQLRNNEPIAEIAAALNFADQSHFSRLFRRTFGTTPSQYRKGFASVNSPALPAAAADAEKP